MRYETIKSIILTFLVAVSILLTWNLWTYQPNYESMGSNNNTLKEVTVSEKQEVQKIIRPDQVLFHINERHYGTTNNAELEKIIKEISKWSIFDLKNFTNKVENYNDLVHGSGNAEIVFPVDVPIELYRSVINIEGRKIPSFNFDRMVVNVGNSGKENGIVYFVSTGNQQVYVAHISAANLNAFNKNFFKGGSQYPRYFAYKATSKRTIFLPEEETKMSTYKYWPITLDSEDFKKALFDDPSFVQKSVLTNGEEYTNDSSKLTINYDKNMLSYVNPTTEDNSVEKSYDLVKRSIDFVNEHGGWSDEYRYVAKDEYKRSVTFRLYSKDGYPVFNNLGMSEIYEVWGGNKINKYIRPNIALELKLTTEAKSVTQPSGYTALEFLQNKRNFKPELLEQMVLGYRMERDADESRLILLEPAWFYRYDNKWGLITLEDLGGPAHGLE
ncbi:YycH family regulatory protein [Neobacillus mesonae]|uniref:YycH family regulatory protein n=1 Tax=Neobacillus mesonae TaxID=1193713 RepID=UPI002573AF74|nr:two-component system activity regulator YycH [Neobacillus mesonae]MED4202701.1 two-component system activity regulator YycH [Neobacillus mesonae]